LRRDRNPLDALDFGRHNVEGFVPADADIPGLAPFLLVALAVRIKVNPLERVQDPPVAVNHSLVAGGVCGVSSFSWRGKGLSPGIDFPGSSVFISKIHWDDAYDFVFLFVYVDENGTTCSGIGFPHVTIHVSPPFAATVFLWPRLHFISIAAVILL
jgi:hypothetical protein